MTIRLATRSLVPFALLALLAACDRPNSPPPPTAGPAANSSQPASSTVALSGTILDPQPDPAAAKPARPAGGAFASTGPASSRRVGSSSIAGYTSGSGVQSATGDGADQQALRDFQAEQERRDRELLDQDLSEAQLRAREETADRERANGAGDEFQAAPPRDRNDGNEPYELAREDGDWSPSDELPPDDEALIDEPPYEEPPFEDELPVDEGYDPRGGSYRP